MPQRAGVILFCADTHGKKKYLLGNESRWVKDIVPKGQWKRSFDHVSDEDCPHGMADAVKYFKSQRDTIHRLVPTSPFHFSQIEHADGVYKTKWMAPHPKIKYGFPKGGCEPSDKDEWACARREFQEETLSKLRGFTRDTMTFVYKGEQDIKMFIVEVEWDIMDDILDKFNDNKEDNFGDGTEFSDLKIFTRRQLERMASNKETNEVAAIAAKKLFERRSHTRSASPKEKRNKTRKGNSD